MFGIKKIWAVIIGFILSLSVGLAHAVDSELVTSAKAGIDTAKSDMLSVGGSLLILFAAIFGLYMLISMLKKR